MSAQWSSSQEVCLSREISKRNIVNGCFCLRAFVPASELFPQRLAAAPGASMQSHILLFAPALALIVDGKNARGKTPRREDDAAKNIRQEPTHRESFLLSTLTFGLLQNGVISRAICCAREKMLFSSKHETRDCRAVFDMTCMTQNYKAGVHFATQFKNHRSKGS